ncbi:MAG TPA: ATP-binding protein, partial [Phenylobacterium sp.]
MNDPENVIPFNVERRDLESLGVTLERVRRVAEALFGAFASDVVISVGEHVWRAADPSGHMPGGDPASEAVISGDAPLWIPDADRWSMLKDHPLVVGEPYLKFYAGAPIRTADGRTVAALTVVDKAPRAYDASLAERLEDLASLVGHEIDRVQALRERAHALEAMARSEQRLKLAVENAGIHVYEVDFVSRNLTKIGAEDTFFEQPKTYEDLWRNVWGDVHPDDLASAIYAWERNRADGAPFRTEYRIRRTDGKVIWAFSSADLVEDEQGKPLRLIGALQDITERKLATAAMEEAKHSAEAANAAKSTFLATMSHEIRTPLNGVLGMVQAMAYDELNPLQRDRLDVIRQSGEALLAILNDVLDLSKIEAGKLELEQVDFDLGDLARGAHSAFTALANKKGLSFALDVEPAKGTYRGDPTRVRQILYNLISNALKFTERGEIRVTAAREENGLAFTVTDTGIGIPPDRLQALFGKFTQADASTTRRFGGTGLGLAICHELVDLMKGAIAVESTPGHGTCFTVR